MRIKPIILTIGIVVISAAFILITSLVSKEQPITSVDVLGKTILMGLTFENVDQGWSELHQTHGKIVALTNGFLQIKKDDGDLFMLPFNLEGILRAKPGEYREKETGQVIEDPDFLVTWTVGNAQRDLIAIRMKYGFGEFEQDKGSEQRGMTNSEQHGRLVR
ncbi:MAG: hypothetical protein WCS52_02090 [bacterium]